MDQPGHWTRGGGVKTSILYQEKLRVCMMYTSDLRNNVFFVQKLLLRLRGPFYKKNYRDHFTKRVKLLSKAWPGAAGYYRGEWVGTQSLTHCPGRRVQSLGHSPVGHDAPLRDIRDQWRRLPYIPPGKHQ